MAESEFGGLSGVLPFSPISTIFSKISDRIRGRYAKSRIGAIIVGVGKNRSIELTAVVLISVGVLGGSGYQNYRSALSGSISEYIEETATSAHAEAAYSSAFNSAPLSPIATASQADIDADTDARLNAVTIQNSSSIAAFDPSSADYIDSFKPDQVVQYVVQDGDSIGSIAADFGVSVNTVIWANNIKNPNRLSIGTSLMIPPVTGVIHTVKVGDTVASIAKKYATNQEGILAFNKLQADQVLLSGTELMVPDGKMASAPAYKAPAGTTTGVASIYKSVGDGQCVPFVQAHGFATLHGNAYQWAKYINTDSPSAGNAVVLKGGRFGHVAIVTAVKAGSIQIVEQNYYGPYIVDHRELALNNPTIVGFIR